MTYAIKLLLTTICLGGLAAWTCRPAFADLLTPAQYRRAWTVVLFASAAAFLSMRVYVFVPLLMAVAAVAARRLAAGPLGAICAWALTLLVVPQITWDIGGVGGINYVVSLDPARAATLATLVVPALRLASRREARQPTSGWIDGLFVAYQLLRVVLTGWDASLTTLARLAFEATIDGFLPYYVLTRGLRSLEDLRFVAAHIVLATLLAGVVALAEAASGGGLYTGLQGLYDIRWQLTFAFFRGTHYRAQAIAPQPILLAFLLMGGVALWVWLQAGRLKESRHWLVLGVLLSAIVVTWSRGPWVATLLLLALVRMARTWKPAFIVGFLACAAAAAIAFTLTGSVDVVLAPLKAAFGLGGEDVSSFDYRQQLLKEAAALIRQSPFWGVANYGIKLQDLRQGQGIVDIVNSYVGLALNFGMVGVVLFLAPYGIVVGRLLRRPAAAAAASDDQRFAASAAAWIVASLFCVFTTSTFGIMVPLFVIMLSMPVAWMRMQPAARASLAPGRPHVAPT